jgi:gliding motility-associated-like protein
MKSLRMSFLPAETRWRSHLITSAFLFIFSPFSPPALAQMQVTSGVFSPQELIENVFLSSGVQVLNVKYEGSTQAIGYFSNAGNNIGIPSGIVMSTGLAFSAALPNTSGSTSGATSGGLPDPDLQSLVMPLIIQDLSAFEIRFVPYADTLEFRYVFASEEYEEYVCTQFNDVFGFFIRGNGFNGPFTGGGENIALVPGTSTYVAINSVHNSNPNQGPIACPPQNPQYFNLSPPNGQPTYDGFTDVFLARAIVVPCDTYTIRLAIADVSDNVYDSGVFLEAKSFGTPAIDFELSTVSANETMAEGCANGRGTFSIRYNTPTDLEIPITFTGTATYGVDYTVTPSTITIPAGSNEVSVTFEVFSDDIIEGTESIGLIFQRNPCRIDTLWFYITDDTLPRPDLGPDRLVCLDDELLLDGSLPLELPQPKTFENPDAYYIPSPPNTTSPLTPVYSPIQVSGVFPKRLGPGMIESVCINILHPWIDDIDVYLVAPSGRFIALTTDNGRDGDHYIETCFSPTATQPIDYGDPFGAPKAAAPFTGFFQPEGRWADLWDAPDNPVNGEWRLLVIDDAPLPDGELQNWRITFNPEYRLDYLWTPGPEVTCDTCAITGLTADAGKTLRLTVTDSYGCSRADTLRIDIQPDVERPEPDCIGIGFKDLQIGWTPQGLGESYQVSVNGGPWQDPNMGNAGFLLDGLPLDDSVIFLVRILGPCNQWTDTIGCRTLNCVPPQVQASQVSSPSCAGGTDGSFQLDLMIGSVPAGLTMNGAAITPGLISGLPAGSYLLVATDTLQCADELMLVLSDPYALFLERIEVDSVACFGDANGALAPMVLGGTGAYAFLWQDGVTDSLRTGLPGGTYALTVTDANGCTTLESIDLFEFPPLLATLAGTDPTCSTTPDGSILVSVQGGAGNYIYSWNQPGISGPAPNNLLPGTYALTITDGKGCALEQSLQLSAPLDLMISVTSLPTSCFGGNDGSIVVTVSGGDPPYDFQWSDGGPNTGNRNNLSAGTYSITVTDQGSCVEVITNIEVFQPAVMVVTGTITTPDCFGDSNGSISVSATGGAGGYSFLWSTGASGPQVNNLPAGPVTVTVTDANGCTMAETFNVTQPSPIQTIGIPKHVTCFGGNDGIATISASGGNGGFSYLWNDPVGTTANVVTNLIAGTYRVTVTDSRGCTAVDSVLINQPPLFTSIILSQPVTCFGLTNGSGTVSPLGGQAPYSYLWSDPAAQSTPTASGLGAGTWFVTITDANNCRRIDTLVLLEPEALLLILTADNITCFGANDGRAQVTVSGGTGPYSFDWTSGSKQSQAQNLPPGTQQVTVTDTRGCTAVASATILQAPEITITGTASDVRCAGDMDGSIDITVTGGAPPYQFAWNHGATEEDPTGLGPGIYVVSVTDAFNCVRTYNIQIVSPPGMLGGLEKSDVACFGDSTGSVRSMISGGSPQYIFLWNNGSLTPDLQGLLPGVYSVTVTDQNACTITRSIEIFQPEEPLTATMVGDTLACFGNRNGRIAFFPQGGTPAYRYSLDGISFNGSSIQIGLSAGTYPGYIRDKEGCEYFVGEATVFEPEPVLIDLGPDLFIDIGVDTQLVAVVASGIPPYSFAWFAQDSAYLSCLACPDPLVQDLEFTRTFRVRVTDANGCTGEATITVHVQKVRIVLVPTAFTPNGDGQNDRMGVVGRPGTLIRDFQIYDRWGEKVFYSDEFLIQDGLLPTNSWNGEFRGKPMNSGVYIWTLEAHFPDGEIGFYRGQTTLLR